jgi:hypothetical protein
MLKIFFPACCCSSNCHAPLYVVFDHLSSSILFKWSFQPSNYYGPYVYPVCQYLNCLFNHVYPYTVFRVLISTTGILCGLCHPMCMSHSPILLLIQSIFCIIWYIYSLTLYYGTRVLISLTVFTLGLYALGDFSGSSLPLHPLPLPLLCFVYPTCFFLSCSLVALLVAHCGCG